MKSLITEAISFLQGRVRETPLERSPGLSELLGCSVLLKLENLQLTGSFKVRGALFELSRLPEAVRQRGVITCSAGNHGAALAYAAEVLKIPARIHVPASVDPAKAAVIKGLGATLVVSNSPSYDATEVLAREDAKARGQAFISAFADIGIMAGNGGSLAAEIFAQCPETSAILFPVSGGGMAAGICAFAPPETLLLAAQHAHSPSLSLSLERGEAVTEMPAIQTLAGGIEGGIGAPNFDLIKDRVHPQVALADEDALYRGVRWLLEHHRYLIEPSAAAVVAACLEGLLPSPLPDPLVVVLSGRNLSMGGLHKILLERGERLKE